MYVFAFFFHLGEWCHVCNKSHFQHEDNSCNTTQRHKHKQQWREERDERFLAWNTVIILSLCQQVPPGGVQQRAANKATALTSAVGSPPPKKAKAGFRCKTSKWERVEEVGRAVCFRGNATLKHGWLCLILCDYKQDPYYYKFRAWCYC